MLFTAKNGSYVIMVSTTVAASSGAFVALFLLVVGSRGCEGGALDGHNIVRSNDETVARCRPVFEGTEFDAVPGIQHQAQEIFVLVARNRNTDPGRVF